MAGHYSPQEIEDSLSGRLPKERSKEVLRHLLRGCAECQAAVRRERRHLCPADPTFLTPEQNVSYNALLDRAEDFARRAASLPPKEQSRFRKALSLLESGDGVLALTEAGNMRLEGLGVYEALLSRSWALRYEDPQAMCHLARAAVEVAQGLDSNVHGPWKVADCAARSWGELANAYRVADRLRNSEKAFIKAYEFFQQGSRDRRLLMRLLDLEASLLGTLRDFDTALERLTSLSRLYQSAGETHLSGRALIKKSLYSYYQGNIDLAYESLEEGLKLIDKNRDSSLTMAASHNHLLILVEKGYFGEAKIVLFKHRANLTGGSKITQLKLRGIEGEIYYGLGKLDRAEFVFREVKQGFRDADLDFACALESLFLAMTLMRQGRHDEAIQEGLEATAAFIALSIHREILGSVLFLEETLQAKTATISLFEKTARYLRRKQIELGIK